MCRVKAEMVKLTVMLLFFKSSKNVLCIFLTIVDKHADIYVGKIFYPNIKNWFISVFLNVCIK